MSPRGFAPPHSHRLQGLSSILSKRRINWFGTGPVQSIFFGGTWIVLWVALVIVDQILVHIPILGVLSVVLLGLAYHVGGFILWLFGVIKAFQGTKWEYPIISEQCKKLFPKLVP